MKVIFYGAGAYLARNFKRLCNSGYDPVCACDVDNTKHNKLFHGNLGLKVLSLKDAIRKYPGAKIYVTVDENKFGEVLNYLINIEEIPEVQIINYTPISYRLGCSELETTIKFNTESIFIRCYWRKPGIERTGDIELDIHNFDLWRKKMMKKISIGETTPCEGCSHLEHGWYPITRNLTSLQLSESDRYSFCNFNCCYCFTKARERHVNESDLPVQDEQLDVLQHVSKNLNDETLELQFSTGELTVHPHRNEILDYFKKYQTILFTNGSVYNDKVADLMRKGLLSIVVSLDCGTRETFLKIKGVDCYTKVCENLSAYAETGGCVILKYIMLPEFNDDEININGFITLAIRLGAVVQISNDTRTKRNSLPERSLSAVKSLVGQARKNNLLVIHEKDVFSEEDNLSITQVSQNE